MNDDVIIADFTEQIKAKTTTTCDACGAKLGASWAQGRKNIGIQLPDGEDESGYEKYKTVHVCDAKCLKKYLNDNIEDDEDEDEEEED